MSLSSHRRQGSRDSQPRDVRGPLGSLSLFIDGSVILSFRNESNNSDNAPFVIIKGEVDDTSGDPVPGATVEVADAITATSGSDGGYEIAESIPDVDFGEAIPFTITAQGYETLSRSETISDLNDFDFTLTPSE